MSNNEVIVINSELKKQVAYSVTEETLKALKQEVSLLKVIDVNDKAGYTSCKSNGCHAKDTNILMFDGSFKKVQDIKVGDLLMGKDSCPRKVNKLYSGIFDLTKNA